ncbi:hypothetical protein RHMOL_Rhmol11G0041300 [Rhododendron molle]|uniref:Uncharacterized protein n=1 Tax=Rhododendron molle TaxID=49168 RepID=A0ACC0LNG3_RHOML|nr:hypothetical protein RHMOL_Rhmol11G0041300 [Rhododendron molle]
MAQEEESLRVEAEGARDDGQDLVREVETAERAQEEAVWAQESTVALTRARARVGGGGCPIDACHGNGVSQDNRQHSSVIAVPGGDSSSYTSVHETSIDDHPLSPRSAILSDPKGYRSENKYIPWILVKYYPSFYSYGPKLILRLYYSFVCAADLAAKELEKKSTDLKMLEDIYGKAYDNGYNTCTRDFEEQISGVTQKIWATSSRRCLEQDRVHEDSPLWEQTQVPEGLDIFMIPAEVDVGNGGTTSKALTAEAATPNQKEARVSTQAKGVMPIISTSLPAPSIGDIIVKDNSNDIFTH